VFAWDLFQCLLILINQFILLRSSHNHVIRWNHNVRIPSANRACSEMLLRCSFVKCSSPFPDAVKTERVRTPIHYTKLTTLSNYFLQTNTAIFIPIITFNFYFFLDDSTILSFLNHFLSCFIWMRIHTSLSIFTSSLQIVFACLKLFTIIQKLVNQLIIIWVIFQFSN
jgi:hypothetical protein